MNDSSPSDLYTEDIEDPATKRERAKNTLKIEAQSIENLIPRIDETFDDAVDMIQNCEGRVVVTGMGKSGAIGRKITGTFASLGTPAFFMHPAEGVHGDLGMVRSEDVVLAISYSGETDEVHSLLDLAPTASTTATLAMGDAIAMALIEEREFVKEDFALFHPGGSLGKQLLLKVRDLMHTGDEIPLVPTDATMDDALVEMTSKKLGITGVVDPEGKLLGCITDGDLRRILEEYAEETIENTAGDVMSEDPITIDADDRAVHALQIMEKHQITELFSLDENGKPDGIIQMHDILRAGISQ
ncbi:MAG: SIS domain-containing protein [bacterium]